MYISNQRIISVLGLFLACGLVVVTSCGGEETSVTTAGDEDATETGDGDGDEGDGG